MAIAVYRGTVTDPRTPSWSNYPGNYRYAKPNTACDPLLAAILLSNGAQCGVLLKPCKKETKFYLNSYT
jgi:hypothetical protein